ncbi:hypothetical protein FIM57_00560 [Helicobacter pylori]|nr:hypothetical protein FIM57_00560 [Helicobacter pylori]
MTYNEPICTLKTHKTFFDAKSGLIFHLNTALLLVSFFSFFQLFIVVFEKRSATHCKRWLLIFNFTAIDDEI